MNSEWKTEDTAPMHQWVLVSFSDYCGLNVQIGKKTAEGWVAPAFACEDKSKVQIIDVPTHWMDLPKPPDTKFDNSDDFLVEIVRQWRSMDEENTANKAEIFNRLINLAEDFITTTFNEKVL